MPAFTPQYRLTVYKPRSIDPTESIALVPLVPGALHADAFQVSTLAGVAGWQPYLDAPRGRKGKIDLASRNLDTGQLTVRLLDKRITAGGSNLQRWMTQFTGDAKGGGLVNGRKIKLEESTNNGAAWADYWTGRVTNLRRDTRLWYELTLQDMSVELDDLIFSRAPHPSATTAQAPQLLPIGRAKVWGSLPATAPFLGTIQSAVTDDRTGLVGVSVRRLATEDRRRAMGLKQTYDLVRNVQASLDAVRAYLTWNAGANSGTYRVGSAGAHGASTYGADRQWFFDDVYIFPVDPTEPGYAAVPALTTAVTFAIRARQWPVTPKMPVLVDDTHPVTMLKWVLDGYFGDLNLDGTVRRAFPRYTGAGAPNTPGDPWYDLEQDGTFSVCRPLEGATMTRRAWIKRHCMQHGLAIALDAAGRVTISDTRARATLGVLPVLANADVVVAKVPQWGHTREGAISRVDCTYYIDRDVPIEEVDNAAAELPDIGPGLIESADYPLLELNVTERSLDANGKPLVIDCVSLRASSAEFTPFVLAGVAVDRVATLRRLVARVQEEYRRVFGAGPMPVSATVRRTAAGDAIQPGKYFLATIDEWVDPSTGQLGAQRLYFCTMRTVDDPGLTSEIEALDCGKNIAATAPTLTLALNATKPQNVIDVGVTLSADVEPVLVEYAITATSVGARPADLDGSWTRAVMAQSTGTQVIGALPSGRRVWVRGSAVPTGLIGHRRPSAYIYPATASVDLTAIAGPTAGAASVITSSSAHLAWTNTTFDDVVDVFLIQAGAAPADWTPYLVATLPPGSTQYDVSGLLAAVGSSYTWLARARDASGGVSTGSGTTFVTTATAVQAPTPRAPTIDTRGSITSIGRLDLTVNKVQQTGIPVGIVAVDPAYDMEIQRAPDSAGAPNVGAAVTIATERGTVTLYFDPLPRDGVVRWYRCRHVGNGATASDYSGWTSGTPARFLRDLRLDEGRQRIDTLYATDGVMVAGVQVRRDSASATTTRIARGGREGTCQHNAAVTFVPPFAGTPIVTMRGGLVQQPNAKWGTAAAVDAGTAATAFVSAPTYEELVAYNQSASGFTARTRLRQKSAGTARTADFSGTFINSVGGTDVSGALANAPSANDQYIIRLIGALTARAGLGLSVYQDVTVAIEVAPTGGAYTERWRDSYSVSDSSSVTQTLNIDVSVTLGVSGLNTSALVRVKVVAANKVGTGTTSYNVRGKKNSLDGAFGVSYTTSAGDVYASKTPDVDDVVLWSAFEVS